MNNQDNPTVIIAGASIISRELHRRYHDSTGIIFNTLCPGCIADKALFLDMPRLFQIIFFWFQKYITKGYVSQVSSGERVAQVVVDPEFAASGNHWSWGNRQRERRKPFAQPLSAKATNHDLRVRLWDYNCEMVGIAK